MSDSDDSSSDSMELFPIQFSLRPSVFNYHDPTLLNGVLRAVADRNLDNLKDLLSQGRSVNINDNQGNTPLHIAVETHNSEIVDFLLSHKDIRINTRNFFGETPIFLAVKENYVDIITKLVEAGANLNLPNTEDVTPLHEAVSSPEVAHLLIEHGAYINATDDDGDTPLHMAVQEDSLDVVCMLLYYNAKANLSCRHNLTPFMKALIQENVEIQTVLFDYVDDFNTASVEKVSTLALALTHTSPFVSEMICRGAEVNFLCADDNDNEFTLDALECCLRVPDVEKFRLIWPKYESQLHKTQGSVIKRLSRSNLGPSYLINYLQIIIDSNYVTPIIVSSLTYNDFYLLVSLHYKHLPINLLTQFLCLLLSKGFEITSKDVDAIFYFYGYCDLLRMLLHMDFIDLNTGSFVPSLLYSVNWTCGRLLEVFSKDIENLFDLRVRQTDIFTLLKYCIHPKFIQNCSRASYPLLKERLDELPTVPSLVELARNASRDYIIKQFHITKARQYFTTVDHFNLPIVYKRILKFEKELY